MTDQPFNPLDYDNLGDSITRALLTRPVVSMAGPLPMFDGVGCYAIYYTGAHPVYEPLAMHNREKRFDAPIYVGRSQEKGSRTGGTLKGVSRSGPLRQRLAHHVRSLTDAENLELEHFHCRWLMTDPVWVVLAEPALIRRFQPVWNTLLAGGFGNNAPGGGRKAQRRSAWDTLHPGRSWAEGLAANDRTKPELEADVAEYVRSRWQV